MEYSMKANYLFTSARLGFRSWSKDDLPEFASLNADAEVMKHFPRVLSESETAEFIHRLQRHFNQHGYCYFATEVIDTGEFIGFIGLAYQEYETAFTPATDIGWRLKRSAWNKGYATEGARRCLDFAFREVELEKVISTCPIKNAKSENVMRKIGMVKKGEFNHPRLSDFPEFERCVWYEMKRK